MADLLNTLDVRTYKKFNIEWGENEYNYLATPHEEIPFEEFMAKMHHGAHSLYMVEFSQIFLGEQPAIQSPEKFYHNRSDYGIWTTHYYFFQNYVIVSCAIYGIHNNAKDSHVSPTPIGLGVWINDDLDTNHGYYMRFFRIGCTHPHLKHVSHRMFEQTYTCPDCDWSATYDSSG